MRCPLTELAAFGYGLLVRGDGRFDPHFGRIAHAGPLVLGVCCVELNHWPKVFALIGRTGVV